jgi:hypothetical protein
MTPSPAASPRSVVQRGESIARRARVAVVLQDGVDDASSIARREDRR